MKSNFENLAIAILAQAREDYQNGNRWEKGEVYDFLASEWGGFLLEYFGTTAESLL